MKFQKSLNSNGKCTFSCLYDTQIKVNILEKEFLLSNGGLWLEISLKGFTWKGYENISHWSRSSQQLRNARSFIIVSIFLSFLQSIITSRNKILVYFTEIQKLTAYIATSTSLIPGLNIRNCHHCYIYFTGQYLSQMSVMFKICIFLKCHLTSV